MVSIAVGRVFDCGAQTRAFNPQKANIASDLLSIPHVMTAAVSLVPVCDILDVSVLGCMTRRGIIIYYASIHGVFELDWFLIATQGAAAGPCPETSASKYINRLSEKPSVRSPYACGDISFRIY